MDVTQLILWLRQPEVTPEFVELHERIAAAHTARNLTDALLNECKDYECIACAEIVCPYGDPLHFHHDGCPACSLYGDKSAE